MNSYAINYQTDAPSYPRASKISKFGFGMTLFLISVGINFISSSQREKKGLNFQKLQNFKFNLSI